MGDLSRNFSRSEFACKCGCGKDDISMRLVLLVQLLRDAVGRPLEIASGCRCEKHNKDEGGKPKSAHVQGTAVDVRCIDGHLRFVILKEAMKLGFKRIGIAKTFIHLDIAGDLPQEVVWLY